MLLQPATQQVSPAFAGGTIADFARLADLLGDREHKMIQMVPTNMEAGALIFFPGFRDAIAVLMPMRSTIAPDELRLPAWLGAPAALPPQVDTPERFGAWEARHEVRAVTPIYQDMTGRKGGK